MKIRLRSPSFALAASLALFAAAPAHLRAGTLAVTTTADSVAGSLRAALKSARSGDTITFSLPAPATITLTGGELVVSKSLRILGPGAGNLPISGRGVSHIFRVSRATVTIAGLTIADGLATATSTLPGAGGGIYNDHGALTVSDCVLTRNTATEPNARGGGAIFNDGYGKSGGTALTVVNCTL